MILFKEIAWKNLISTGNAFTRIELNSHHLTLLMGESGSGKSTLLDALAFVLFNRPYRIKTTKPQLVNSINRRDCVVELSFSIGTKEYFIRRGIKPNIFEIHVDGVLLNQNADSRDYQAYLEKNILKFNFDSMKHIIVLGASDFVPFMRLKPADRRGIIDELLDIEIYSKMKEVLNKEQSNLKSRMVDNQYNTNLVTEKIAMLETHLGHLKQDVDQKLNKKLNKQQEVKQIVDKLQTDHNDLLIILKLAKSKIRNAAARKAELTKKLRKCNILEMKLASEIQAIQQQIKFYQDHQTCPTCTQVIDMIFKGEIKRKQEDKIKEAEKTHKKVMTLHKNLLTELEEIKTEEEGIAKVVQDMWGIEQRLATEETMLRDVEKEITELKSPGVIVTEQQERLTYLKKKQVHLEEQREAMAKEKQLQELTNELLKDSGIKATIVKEYLPVINSLVNKFLNAMNFFVTFEIDEEFNEVIRSRGRDEFSYGNFSEGEKQRIDLALLFAWRTIAKSKNSVSTNLLILDEVSDSYLNQDATENVLDMLKSDVLKGCNIFVISHKETIVEKFDNVIKFRKHRNFSQRNLPHQLMQ